MTWITASDDDKPILEEIEKQTDRASALIATSYLEDRLLSAIKARIVRDDKLEQKMFRGSGPLTAFSAKIDLAFMLGIYGGEVQKMLHTIREIRNEFAHQPQPRDFNSQRIKDLCDNISFSAYPFLRPSPCITKPPTYGLILHSLPMEHLEPHL